MSHSFSDVRRVNTSLSSPRVDANAYCFKIFTDPIVLKFSHSLLKMSSVNRKIDEVNSTLERVFDTGTLTPEVVDRI